MNSMDSPNDSDPLTSLSLPPLPATASPRPELGAIVVTGPDAATFLNGQLTAGVASMPERSWTWTGYCAPNGRLLAVARIARLPHAYVLQLPAELAGQLASRLARFVLRAKVRIAAGASAVLEFGDAPIARDILTQLGISPPPAPGSVFDSGDTVAFALREDRWSVFVPNAVLSLLESPSHADPDAGWRADILAGVPWIVSATQEAFIPQMVDLDLIGGVSFDKGCYPGQEVVARARYVGEVKRHLYRLSFPAGDAPQPGASVAGPEDRTVGTILLGAGSPTPDSHATALAVVDDAAATRGGLRLPDGRLAALPERVHPAA